MGNSQDDLREQFKTARIEAGLTQEEAAKRLGVSVASVSRKERGEQPVLLRDVAGMRQIAESIKLGTVTSEMSGGSEASRLLDRIRATAAYVNTHLPHATPNERRRLRRELEAVIRNWLEVKGAPADTIDEIAKTFVGLYTNEQAERTQADSRDESAVEEA